MATPRFSSLKARVAQLDRHLLPPIKPAGNYTAREYDMVRSYIVLAHAEIENYIEDLAEAVIAATELRWRSDKRSGRGAAALLLYHDKRATTPSSLAGQSSSATLDTALGAAIRRHREYISRENHGVKEKNLLRLLLPIGILDHQLDPVWLANMDSFGAQRGIVAHVSARRVKTPPDPGSTRKSVEDALAGLKSLEPMLRQLMKAL